jgi:hypothetical protein
LSVHTRSTRYLTAVAGGQQRHDLQGLPVEVMAPEHVHHALLEVFRRRQTRTQEDLRPKLRSRMLQAFEASGLSREAYTELVRSRDEAANALLDEALAQSSERAARAEALLRAFEASGQTVEAFADMYGLDPQTAARMLAQARRANSGPPAPAPEHDAAAGRGARVPCGWSRVVRWLVLPGRAGRHPGAGRRGPRQVDPAATAGRFAAGRCRLAADRVKAAGADPPAYRSQVFQADLRTDAFDQITPLAYLATVQARYPGFDASQVAALVEGLSLTEHQHKPMYMLSTGSRRKVWFAAAGPAVRH